MKENYLKTTLVFILIVAMVIVFAFPATVKADGENVAKTNNTEYATIEEAVEAAPTDGTQTTITLLKSVTNGTGFIIKAGQNIVIDFNKFSYDASNPLVGSKGTETNGCQLLKGSTVTLENGTLVSTAAAILIQNYSNLTLKDMNISATKASYVSSNNCGKVNIIGNTSMTAKDGASAFDMCWAPNKNYPEGTQITVDTTGTIKGNIELDTWGTTNGETIKSTLDIKNINHVGAFKVEDALKNQITVEGGTYSSESVKNYVKSDYAVIEKNSIYTVGTGSDIEKKIESESKAGDTITVVKGDLNLVLPTPGIIVGNESSDKVIVNDTETKAGTTAVETKATNLTLPESTDKTVPEVNLEATQYIPGAKTLEVEKISIENETKTATEKTAGESLDTSKQNASVINIFNISLKDALGNKLDVKNQELTITIKVGKDVIAKYKSFKIVYVGETTTETFDATIVGDDSISFKTSHLSEYALVGVSEIDTTTSSANVKTGDNVIIISAILAISLITGVVTLKKRRVSKH